jgi:O-antigen ligase
VINLNWIKPEWKPLAWRQALLIAGAIVGGLTLTYLPLGWAIIALVSIILITLSVIDPLVGLGVALVLGPTKPLTDYFVPELPLDLGQLAMIVTLASWSARIVLRRALRIPYSPLTLPVLIFIGAASLSLPSALSIGYALKEWIKWAEVLLVIWLILDYEEKRRWPLLIGSLLLSAALQAGIGVWQFGLRGEGPEHFLILGDRFYRAYGTFEQPNPYGGFIGLILPVAIALALGTVMHWWEPLRAAWQARRGRELIHKAVSCRLLLLLGSMVLAGLLFAALIMSWSRGAWMGLGAAMLALLLALPRKTWVGFVLAGGAVTLGIVALRFNLLPSAISSRLTGFTEIVQIFDVRGVDINPANYAVLERLAHWQAAEQMARYHLLFGVGLGNYEPVYPAYALLNWPQPLGHAHNIYLNLLAETGIIGLLAYGGLWCGVLWQTWRATRHTEGWQRLLAAGLLGAWVHLSVHQLVDKLYVANLHLHIGALLGMLSMLSLTDKEKYTAGEQHN